MRERNLVVRVLEAELAAFRSAASPAGLPVSTWARMRLIQAARQDEAAFAEMQQRGLEDAADAMAEGV